MKDHSFCLVDAILDVDHLYLVQTDVRLEIYI